MPIAAIQKTDELDNEQLLKVLMAFKKGDFSARMPLDKTRVAGKIADTLNDIIETKECLLKETQKAALLVGKEGKVSQRLSMEGMVGGWANAVDSVNSLIGDLVQPTNEMARVIGACAKGYLTQTVTLEIEGRPLKGEFLHTAKVVNSMISQLGLFASEVTRVAKEVGTEGKLALKQARFFSEPLKTPS